MLVNIGACVPAKTYQELTSHQYEDAAASAGLGIESRNLVLHLLEREALKSVSEYVAMPCWVV